MNKLIAWLLCFLLVGCATTGDVSDPIHSKDLMTEIVSDPPGAKIEINSEYVGEAPLTLHIQRLTNSIGWWESFSITAIPTQPGQYVQRKFINIDQRTPQKVYFNMYLGPATPEVDVNVNNQ